MEKLTKGEWKPYPYKSANMDNPAIDIATEIGIIICRQVENKADARLIVQAKAMLEAMKKAKRAICATCKIPSSNCGEEEHKCTVISGIDSILDKLEE